VRVQQKPALLSLVFKDSLKSAELSSVFQFKKVDNECQTFDPVRLLLDYRLFGAIHIIIIILHKPGHLVRD